VNASALELDIDDFLSSNNPSYTLLRDCGEEICGLSGQLLIKHEPLRRGGRSLVDRGYSVRFAQKVASCLRIRHPLPTPPE
jgi:hypothetical protein